MKLHIATDLSLPPESVSRTFGLLAARGAGKSNAAAVMAEEMFAAGLPFVVIDPVGSWYGLRSSGDGASAGLPIPIFGGKHGDIPLDRTNGVLMADLIVGKRLSCVLDLSTFDSENAKKQFLLDFARQLYLKNEDPLHLFLEEADDYIPQKPMRDEAQLLRAWENIVRRGRSRGLGMTMITQRSASINKSVLTQVETLFALRTTGPQDIAAIREWVKYHQVGDEVLSTLASLPDGDAWVWSPNFLNVMKRVHIRRRRTFDSGATPKNLAGTHAKPVATLADVDLREIQTQMAATIEKAKADDPRELRKQIAELKRRWEAANRQQPQPEIKTVEVSILRDEDRDRINDLIHGMRLMVGSLQDVLGVVERVQNEVRQSSAKIGQLKQPVKHSVQFEDRLKLSKASNRQAAPSSELGNSGLRRILIALAQYPQGRSARQIGILAGLSSKSGSFNTYLSKGRSSGWIDGERGLLRITDGGVTALGDFDPLPRGQELLEYWLRDLGDSGAARILRVLADRYPKSMSKAEVGAAANLSHASGSFNTYLSKLRTLELIEGRGELRASETLFE